MEITVTGSPGSDLNMEWNRDTNGKLPGTTNSVSFINLARAGAHWEV